MRYVTQPAIKPGPSYPYEFPVPKGSYSSHMYDSHHNAAKQVAPGRETERAGDLRRAPPVVRG